MIAVGRSIPPPPRGVTRLRFSGRSLYPPEYNEEDQHLAIAPHLPFGGAKWSGIGVENGPWGLLGFTEIQVLNVARG